MTNLLIIGPTNNGKSMIIEKFKRMHKVITYENTPKETNPIVALQMPSDPTIARFYSMLLYNLGAPVTIPLQKNETNLNVTKYNNLFKGVLC